MTTCFIFAEYFDEEGCLSLRLDQQGDVDAPLLKRPIETLQALQSGARTVIVLPTNLCSLHELALPWLGERKAQAAIPYALEEQLAQPVTSLHVCFDRQYYVDNRYLVVVTDKPYLVHLMQQWDALNLDYDEITLDWFALNQGEACATASTLLVNDQLFKGALSGELAAMYDRQGESTTQCLAFKDSLPALVSKQFTILDERSAVWIAKRLLTGKKMNLCQGELQHNNRQPSFKYWYGLAGILAGVSLACMLFLNVFYLYLLNNKIADVDKKIAAVYHHFFPEAKQVISPKFRVEQLLKAGRASTQSAACWTLLDKLAHAIKGKLSHVEQIRFQHPILSVTLVAKDFASLEALQQRLKEQQVNVTQVQASTEEHHVIATLELSL